tara:strand:+ start:613 stop:1839 length:1227 start_codon:yes stop_codon:yes gene_type:complete
MDLLQKGAELFDLSNIKKILTFAHSTTICDEEVEKHGLDPWVQWVSVHTGKQMKSHQVVRTGEVPKLIYPQIWEILGSKGISTGVWGAMNASRNNSKQCKFFMPDPWTFSEEAHPRFLNNFLSLPRYYAKNYISLSKVNLIQGFSKAFWFFLKNQIFVRSYKEIFRTIGILFKHGIKNSSLVSLFDIYSTLSFIKYKKKYDPDFSILFLNSIAHFQHHFWENDINKEIELCLKVIDNLIGLLISSTKKNEPIIIMNGLGQRNIYNHGVYIYRQIDPDLYLHELGISFVKVEQGMTNDGHVFFRSLDEMKKASAILRSAKIKGSSLFFLEEGKGDSYNLFYQIDFEGKVDTNENYLIQGKEFNFFKHFVLLRQRTGEHVPFGDILSSSILLPPKLKNYSLIDSIIEYYK